MTGEPRQGDAGFAAIPVWLLRDPDLDVWTKMVYLTLAARMNRNGVAWPSQARMAEELGCSVSSVKRATATLKRMGIVEVRVEITDRGRRNKYLLRVHPTQGVGSQ